MRLYFTPLTSGSDAYANELAIEWQEDPDALSITSSAASAALTALEALATLAREAPGEADAGAVQATRRVQRGDAEALLGWIAL